MTKYEWETELKKNIHRLPPDEIKRVMEYYNELFDDYAERGKRETEIIHEFGNPIDIADKILSEYDAENPQSGDSDGQAHADARHAQSDRKDLFDREIESDSARFTRQSDVGVERDASSDPKPEPRAKTEDSAAERENGRGARVALFILINILTGGVFFIAAGAVWIVLGALVVSGAASVGGGFYAVVISIGVAVSASAGAGIAQIGIGFAAIGVGIALTAAIVRLIKRCAVFTKRTFARLCAWLGAKKEGI